MDPMLRRRLLLLVAVVGLLEFFVFAYYLIQCALTQSITYDDAYNASVAKNVALSVGYASTYHEPTPFDPLVSTGPAVILPAALLMRLFGPTPTMPSLAAALQNLMLLALIATLIARRLGYASIPILVGCLFSYIVFTSIRSQLYFDQWYVFLGEVAGSLFFLAGLCVLNFCKASRRRTIIAALLIGFSSLCKTIYLLGIVTVVVVNALCEYPRMRAKGSRLSAWLIHIGVFGALSVLPLTMWHAYSRFNRTESSATRSNDDVQFITSGGSGLSELMTAESPSTLIWNNLRRNGSILFAAPARPTSLLLLITLLGCNALLGLWRSPHSSRPHIVAASLLLAALVHYAWWLALSPLGWMRHLSPALLYAAPGVVFGIACLDSIIVRSLTIAFCFVMLSAKLDMIINIYQPPNRLADRLIALGATADFLGKLESDRAVLLGVGWWANRDLEYVMPGVLHFRDLMRTTRHQVRGKSLYLVRSELFEMPGDRWSRQFVKECERQTIFARPPFFVFQCKRLPAKRGSKRQQTETRPTLQAPNEPDP